jgi:hypothetical protein
MATLQLEHWHWLRQAHAHLDSKNYAKLATFAFPDEWRESPEVAALKTADDSLGRAAAEAEFALSKAQTICQDREPDAWTTFRVTSELGDFQARHDRFTSAEPLLVVGYQGLRQRKGQIPWMNRKEVRLAAERLVRLYERWNRPLDAEKWRRELENVAN